jgi:hypothetical protein
MEKPTIQPEQIAQDAYYFATSKAAKAASIGSRSRSLHDMSTFGKTDPSERWYRVWEKTEDGWKYLGMQFGRQEIEK